MSARVEVRLIDDNENIVYSGMAHLAVGSKAQPEYGIDWALKDAVATFQSLMFATAYLTTKEKMATK